MSALRVSFLALFMSYFFNVETLCVDVSHLTLCVRLCEFAIYLVMMFHMLCMFFMS